MDFLNVERVEVLRDHRPAVRAQLDRRHNRHREPPADQHARGDGPADRRQYSRLRAEAAVSGPLIKDRVMANVAFIRDTRDGYVKDLDHADHSLGGLENWAGRGHVRVVFSPRNEMLVSADYGRFEGVPLRDSKPILAKPGYSFDNPDSPWAFGPAIWQPDTTRRRARRRS